MKASRNQLLLGSKLAHFGKAATVSANWTIKVAGQVYGPYTDAQMAGFIAEGRVAPPSLVAQAGAAEFRPAGEEPALAPLFAPAEPMRDAESHRENRPIAAFGRVKDRDAQDLAHVIIVADMKSGSIAALEEEIHKLGNAFPVLPQMWLLRTDQTVNSVRNLLVQQLGRLDKLFVADATHDKAAWFNFAPETDSRIRRLWSREPK